VFKASDRNSSITLRVDGGPGVVITQWASNGTDVLSTDIINATDARLYPAQLSRIEIGTNYHAFRAQLAPERQPSGAELWPELLDSWYFVDAYIYNNLATDAFVIGIDSDGVVQSVRSDSLRVTMYRAEK
jgi:hypothetical protein